VRLPCLIAVVACSFYHSVEEVNGYRDVRLGSSLRDVPGMVVLTTDTYGEVTAHRPDEPGYHGASAVAVRYYFWNDNLWRIEVKSGDSRSFLSELVKEFGTPSFVTPWEWHGETVHMKFVGTEHDASAVLRITKLPLQQKRNTERADRMRAIGVTPRVEEPSWAP
jgi:hypothetical protein